MRPFFKRKKNDTPEPPPADATTVPCDWCGKPGNPLHDGFHLLQIAFGLKQQRYHFCTDACYESFRALYPSRIHRNCYEQSCATCSECQKTFPDEADSIRAIAPEGSPVKHPHGRGGGGHHHHHH